MLERKVTDHKEKIEAASRFTKYPFLGTSWMVNSFQEYQLSKFLNRFFSMECPSMKMQPSDRDSVIYKKALDNGFIVEKDGWVIVQSKGQKYLINNYKRR